ncbi:MAG: T9SS type A sorting domain-containing protein [Ignavibacteria bacterium]|jgi:hypothetical protein|nr:T9SS type A sorting domain-containing protein [Ignavibacteria bacterium]
MKRIFTLVALFALSITLLAYSPAKFQEAMKIRPLGDVNAKSTGSPALKILLEGMKLDNKNHNFLLEGEYTEFVARQLTQGQLAESNPQYGYNMTYEPYSKTFFGFTASRSGVTTGDSIRKRGVLTVARFNENAPYDTMVVSGTYLYDFTEPIASTTTLVPTHEYFYSSITASNPSKSSDISDVRVAFGSRYYTQVPGKTGRGPEQYKWFGFTTGGDMIAGNEASNYADIEPWNNAITGYAFNNYIKGTAAVIDGNPIHVFWGEFKHTSENKMLPISYGLMAYNFKNMPAPGSSTSENVEVFEMLPPSIMKGFFNDAVMTEDNSAANNMGADFDNNGNLYLGFLQPSGARFSSDELSTNWRGTTTPTVIKTKYTGDEELFPGTPQIDTMPISVIEDYINSRGGYIDITSQDETYETIWMGDGIYDIPITVIGEDDYSMLSVLRYNTADEDRYGFDLVELSKHNGQWAVRLLSDVYKAWTGATRYSDATRAYFCYADEVVFMEEEIGGKVETYAYPLAQRHDIQLSKTADGQYYVAKWKQIWDSKDTIILNEPVSFYFMSFTNSYNDGDFLCTTDTLYKSSLMLSYRHKDSPNWSTPVKASNYDLNFNNSLMPKTIPDIDAVPITIGYAAQQDDLQAYWLDEKKIQSVAYNWLSWTYSSMIMPSAKTGATSIVENGEADANTVGSVYPNPASGVANIDFSITTPNYTTITITNAFGQTVEQVINGQFMDAGSYKVDFKTTDLSVGAYYVTISSGSFVQTRMFTVVR